MRPDSPAVFAIAGTLLIHLALAIIGDVLIDEDAKRGYEPPPRVAVVDIEPIIKPPPPPVPAPEPPPPPAAEVPAPEPQVQKAPPRKAVAPRPTPSAAEPPPTEQPPSPAPEGGAPTMAMENIGLDATGTVPVGTGKRPDRVGRGGTGTGTGAGTGAGSATPPPGPMSVATIKKRAMPKEGFGYLDLGKDYPAEAKSLGIEGQIRVRLVVDDQGKVKTAVLLNKLGHGLDELALDRAKRIEFQPALDSNDAPVSSVVVWTFNMTLPK